MRCSPSWQWGEGELYNQTRVKASGLWSVYLKPRPLGLGSFLTTIFFSSSVFVPCVCSLSRRPPASPASVHLLLPAWRMPGAGPAVGLLAVVVVVCGVALVAVFLFLFWKLCWSPWRNKETSSPSSAKVPSSRGAMADKLKNPSALGFLEAAVKISHTSPDIPAEVQMSVRQHIVRHTRLQRQTTEPASSTR